MYIWTDLWATYSICMCIHMNKYAWTCSPGHECGGSAPHTNSHMVLNQPQSLPKCIHPSCFHGDIADPKQAQHLDILTVHLARVTPGHLKHLSSLSSFLGTMELFSLPDTSLTFAVNTQVIGTDCLCPQFASILFPVWRGGALDNSWEAEVMRGAYPPFCLNILDIPSNTIQWWVAKLIENAIYWASWGGGGRNKTTKLNTQLPNLQ